MTSHARADADRAAGRRPGGDHGYDPALASMRGLFLAVGPDLRAGLRVPAFENIHLYEFMCRILRLTPAPNDGASAVTRAFLKNRIS